jgi:hypothetical protein
VRTPVVLGLVVVVGVLSGVGGALVATRNQPAPAASMPAPTVHAALAPAPTPSPPPGWDPRFLSRFTALEADVARLASALDGGAPSAAREPSDDRGPGDTRLEQYVRELGALDARLAQHASEPLDPGWAKGEATILEKGFAASAGAGRRSVVGVDCRSRTCVVRLRFASPDDAVEQTRQISSVYVEGCNGLITTLPPPTGTGPYEVPVFYTCRAD